MDMATCPLVWVPTLIQKIFARFRPQRVRHLALQPSNFARLRSNLLAMGRGRRAIVPMRGCMDHHCPLSAFPSGPCERPQAAPFPHSLPPATPSPLLGATRYYQPITEHVPPDRDSHGKRENTLSPGSWDMPNPALSTWVRRCPV
ncbi:hypothetical protein C8Q76DRAFT_354895 [Earliella scabrosa]|nr:hypothetical protein C8Q76DRAFT_354895 [Earliella scabrosa]